MSLPAPSKRRSAEPARFGALPSRRREEGKLCAQLGLETARELPKIARVLEGPLGPALGITRLHIAAMHFHCHAPT